MNEQENCRAALEPFVARDLTRMGGWARDCRVAQLTAGFSLVGKAGGFLGVENARRSFGAVEVPGYREPVRIWSEEERAILLEVDFPGMELTAVAEAALGAPDGRLDCEWGSGVREGAEWVWARRGLALWVAPETRAIQRLALFPPTTLDEYRRTLRATVESREEE